MLIVKQKYNIVNTKQSQSASSKKPEYTLTIPRRFKLLCYCRSIVCSDVQFYAKADK